MNFFAVLLALLCEQLKPLRHGNGIHRAVIGWVRWTGRNFDAGREHHSTIVWAITVLGPALAVAIVYLAVRHFSLLLALALDVAVLYLTLGFRQFSHYFTDIRDALERADDNEARRLLSEWRHLDASELPRTELVRHAIEHSLLAAHRHVFGVFFCFILFSTLGLGPAGAVLYRMAEFAGRYWAFKSRTLDAPTNERLMQLSRRLFGLIDYMPARFTAAGFTIVGNFEEAVNGWRRDARLWLHPNEGIILASAAGALGLQLGGVAAPGVTPDRSKTFSSGVDADATGADGSTPGQIPQLGHLQSVVGLIWRSVVLWMLLLALLTLANLLG
ncbi:MAG: CobD/CbiB family protein [Burkholderiaceae bacterium]|uniref:CobD/CbiB family protein n=1 Tax=Paucibacter sp. KCTC 42545 TaxID=1768242 RepID=UPI000733C46B|nr:CobD/CbiB family protein [Paucibacter sp. KCTC 42545]ALT77501.1 cobalamin biosynthesis protein CbiB [Paucibacter sp. KCTC 42545]MBY0236774.1 CobD/CbiB family protein [Burkholderiaceae bacterium]